MGRMPFSSLPWRLPGFPRFSPDGTLITFHTNAEEHANGQVYVVPSKGGPVRKVTGSVD